LQVALHVLLDALDHRGAAGERQVEDVAALARLEPHAAAGAQRDPVDLDRVGPGALELLPVAWDVAHRITCQSRIVPCRRMISSGVSDSVRSRISAARSQDARISAFSVSVRLRMWRTSIWSISPPSKRSPGLSGAIRGWSSRMIGEDSSRSVAPASPTSTGQVPAFSQSWARRRSPAGGSVSDTNAPPSVRSTVWVEQNVRSSASSRAPPSHG